MFTKWSRSWFVAALVSAAVLAPCMLPAAPEPPASTEATERTLPTYRVRRPSDVTKVFVLQHVHPSAMADVLRAFPAQIDFAATGPLAIGVSSAPGVMAVIEETIKRLDVPRPHKSIEVTGYLLEARTQPLGSPNVPSELEAVVTQLKRTFNYAEYRLMDTLIVRGVEDAGLKLEAVGADEQALSGRLHYKLSVAMAEVLTAEEGPIVRLRGFKFETRIPIPAPRTIPDPTVAAGVQGDIEIRAGQRVVVGKSGVADPSKAIILVLSARVVD